MSLVKQLWIGIIILLIISLGGSFLISTLTAQSYLEEQLQLKNIDTATAMALSMSQMEKDPVTINLLVSAQFDTGHYESIRLLNPDGETITEHHYVESQGNSIPEWFSSFLTLSVSPGIAQIQDGWQQFGTLYIHSHSHFAEEALWQSTIKLVQWLLAAALICGLVGTTILKFITKPLNNVITQAESIGQRHFVTSTEPKTWEFKLLVQAMNKLSASVKSMLEKKTQELEVLQEKLHQDPLTKLPNREHFLNMFDSSLTREDSDINGSLCIVRILNLAEVNQRMGHLETDKILKKIASTLFDEIEQNQGSYAGRLNGTDFIFVSFSNKTISYIANRLSNKLSKNIQNIQDEDLPLALPIAGSYYQPGETRGEVLARLDGALALAEQKGNHAVITLEENAPTSPKHNAEDWREIITTALSTKQIRLGNFPVRTVSGELIHCEMPVRLNLNSQWQPAGYFIGWAVRLKMLKDIDLHVLQLALEKIKQEPQALAINMSEDALCSVEFRAQVKDLLKQHPEQAPYLWIEFPETCAVRHLAQFRQFCTYLRTLGCQIGLEHVGLEFTQIRELHDIGIHYLKIDSAIIRDIDTQTKNHEFVKGLCSIGHSLGITMIAEGVMNIKEQQTLESLNIDGVTGPGVN